MNNVENGLQLKIDKLILNALLNNDDKRQQERYDDITTLISYMNCLDLFDFLEKFSKIQKNELLFQISFIYGFLGFNKISLDYISESLKIIQNVPTIILFKSCLYVSMNRLDDAQKYLVKYKYLIGEDIFGNYIYNIVRIIYYYLLDYEENIILREINIIETQTQKLIYNNAIIFYIKSILLNKLSEKLKQIDKKRSNIYKNDSILSKEKAFKIEKKYAEYLFKFDINKENVIKIITMIFPNFIEYRPKPLIDYNNNFHCGFRLFYTLFKICKIFKLKIQLIKYKIIVKNNQDNKNFNLNFSLNDNILEKILYSIENDSINIENTNNKNYDANECKNIILKLSKSFFIQNYINNKKRIKFENIYNELNNINIDEKLKTSYYINKGFYSNMNLNKYILHNINRNIEYKESKKDKDYFIDEAIEDFNYNIKKKQIKDDFKLQLKHSIVEENEENILKNKLLKNKKENKINLTKSNQNKNALAKNYKNKTLKKDIILRKSSLRDSNKNRKNLDEEKNKKSKYYGSHKNIVNNNVLRESRKINVTKKNCKDNKYDNLITNNKENFESIDNNKNKLNENKESIYKNIKTENSSNNKKLNIFSTIKIITNRDISNYVNLSEKIKNISKKNYTNEKIKNIRKKQNKINNNKSKDKPAYIENDLKKKVGKNNNNFIINKNSENKNTIKNEVNINRNYKSSLNKKYKLNNINYGIQTHNKKAIYYTINNNKNETNENLNDIINLKTNYEQVNQIIKKENSIKLLNNIGKKEFIKTSNNKNIEENPSIKNTLKYFIKTIENKNNRNDLNIKRSEFNSLEVRKNENKYIYSNNLKNYSINNKDIQSMNNNFNNKIKTILELKPIKINQKKEKAKGNQLSIENNFINNLAINFDLSKAKLDIQKYQKTSLFNSIKVDSKDRIKRRIKIKPSKKYMDLKKKIKNSLNLKGSKVFVSKYKSSLSRAIYYFNNILNRNNNISNIRIRNISAGQ